MLAHSTHLAGGKKKVVFEVTPLMSTYLLAWAIGEFDSVQVCVCEYVSM